MLFITHCQGPCDILNVKLSVNIWLPLKLYKWFSFFPISIFSNFTLTLILQQDIDISPNSSCQISLLLSSATPRERHPSDLSNNLSNRERHPSNLSNNSDNGSYQGPRVSPYSGLAPDTVSMVCRPGPGSCSVDRQYCSVSVDNVNKIQPDSGDNGGQVIFLHNNSGDIIIFSVFFQLR